MTNQDYMDIDKCIIENIDDVAIIDIVVHSDKIGFDALMFRYYSGDTINILGVDSTLRFIPLVLLFNNIHDITTLRTGTYIKIPDINSLIDNIKIIEDEEQVPGIVTTENNLLTTIKSRSKLASTTALPKIPTTLPNVNVNYETGLITF